MELKENSALLFTSKETKEALLGWNKYDDDAERFCVADGEADIIFG